MIQAKYVLFIFILLSTILFSCSDPTNPNDSNATGSFVLNVPEIVTNSYISLSWSKYPYANFKEYKIKRELKGYEDLHHDDFFSVSTNPNDTSYIDYGLISDKNYTYSIQVVTSTDSIIISNTIKVKTKKSALDCAYDNKYTIKFAEFFKTFDKTIKGIYYHDSIYWILLFKANGGYYDINNVEIVKYNLNTDEVLQVIDIPDTYIIPTGIVYDSKNIWVSFSNSALENKLYKINQENGEVVKVFNVHQNVVDMGYDMQYIYLCSSSNWVVKFNPQTENFIEEFRVGQNEINSTGIMTSDSLLWVAYNQGKLIGIYNKNGLQTGYAIVDEFNDWNESPRLSVVEDRLLIIENGNAKFMNVIRY